MSAAEHLNPEQFKVVKDDLPDSKVLQHVADLHAPEPVDLRRL